MKNKKKLTAVAVTTALSISILTNPLIIHAQESNIPKVTQQKVTNRTGDLAIDENNFPDTEFRDYVQTILAKGGDTLTEPQIANIEEIDIQDKPALISLEGIKNFTNLKKLTCARTGIKALNLSNNKVLNELQCYGNLNLSTLDISGCSQLEYLVCKGEGIRKLNISNNKELTYLDCSYTNLIELDASQCKELNTLLCVDTNISSLDLTNNSELTSLDCYNNANLTNLDVSKCEKLEQLSCYNTSISSLDLTNNSKLTYLSCRDNVSLTKLDISKCEKLDTLYCHKTSISSLDLTNNSKLTFLDCYNNTNLTKLDVSKCENLVELYCYNTSITSLDLSNNLLLRILQCQGAPLAYLNIGLLNSLDTGISAFPSISNLSFQVTGRQFNIKDTFPEIDIAKISNVNNASYHDGIFSNYSLDNPISYDYDCGKRKTMNVTLNLEKGKTVITINKDLNKIYDGKAVSLDTKDITVEGSSKTPQLTWWEEVNGTWHKITFAPVNVGNYGVSIDVKEDEFCEEGNLEKVEFKITPKDVVDNQDIVIPDINENTKIEDIIIKDIDKELEEGKDYDVEIKKTENKVEIILTFKGNYTGIITKGYEIAIPETEKKEQPEIKENEFKEKQAVADTGGWKRNGTLDFTSNHVCGNDQFYKKKETS